uniref:Eukaryotic translation initiation factor 3 subunit G n=1 Tax=Rhabditophanes sp. KR3021 TaxID=114890 RepID=A0AC35UEF3_9BILA
MSTVFENVAPIGSWVDAVDKETNRQANEKTITEVIVDPVTGNRRVVTQTIRTIVERIPKQVADRKRWKKFGQCARDSVGPQAGITMMGDTIDIEFIRTVTGEQRHDEVEDKKEGGASGVTAKCHRCMTAGHWSKDCPYRNMAGEDKEENDRSHPLRGTVTAGKYVAPGRSGDGGSRGPSNLNEKRSDEFTVRVTNLPEDIPELDDMLRKMFNTIGRIDRFFLAKDKITGLHKGFAFITYTCREDAEKAISRFNNQPLDHLIIKVEFAKA